MSNTADQTFPKSQHLRTSRDYRTVFNERDFEAKSAYFVILAKANTHAFPRIGIIVSKRVSNKAVIRNRFKRIIRESFRQHKKDFPNADIVIIVRKQTNETRVLNDELTMLWQKMIKAL